MPYYPKETKEVLNYIGERFLAVMEHLIDTGKVNTEQEFAESLNVIPQHVSQMKNQKRFITIQMLYLLCMKYAINPGYLLPPFSKNMFIKDNNKTLIKQKRIQIEQLKKEIHILEAYS
ncbi:MAG: hypothetical protein H7Y00_09440 [Fimbriimonadaceae bacterium]|nr:hypothetical protein [Chitinophagales bacterium]